MTETEIKLRWPEHQGDPLVALKAKGFTIAAKRTLESDQLYDRKTETAPAGQLRQSDQVLRLRRAGGTAVATYKGPASRERYKSREEIEFEVSDADAFHLVLLRLGYLPLFRYEKYRTKFVRSGEPGIVSIDETPVGVFLELEGPKDWIDTTAEDLGFKIETYLTISYASLYREYCTYHPEAPMDMIFQN